MDLWHRVMALCLQIQYIVQRTQSKLFRAIADIPWYTMYQTKRFTMIFTCYSLERQYQKEATATTSK